MNHQSSVIMAGHAFSSYQAVEAAMKRLEDEQLTTYYRRNSLSLSKAPKDVPLVNDSLIYYRIQFRCFFAGRKARYL